MHCNYSPFNLFFKKNTHNTLIQQTNTNQHQYIKIFSQHICTSSSFTVSCISSHNVTWQGHCWWAWCQWKRDTHFLQCIQIVCSDWSHRDFLKTHTHLTKDKSSIPSIFPLDSWCQKLIFLNHGAVLNRWSNNNCKRQAAKLLHYHLFFFKEGSWKLL